MLTSDEKMRAARMYAVDFSRKLFAECDFTGHTIAANEVLIKLGFGELDGFAAVRNALSALNRLQPLDGVHNAVQALQYLRGRDRGFNEPHPMRDDPRRYLGVYSPLTTGYVHRHSSDRY